jgi:hypothetical protein
MSAKVIQIKNQLALRRETLDGKANVRISTELSARLDAACKALDGMSAGEFVRRSVRRWKSGKLQPVVVLDKTKNGTTTILTIKNWPWPEMTDGQLREIVTAQVEEIERHPPPAVKKFEPSLIKGVDYVVKPEIMD